MPEMPAPWIWGITTDVRLTRVLPVFDHYAAGASMHERITIMKLVEEAEDSQSESSASLLPAATPRGT
jgi:hypothetical protein